MSELSPSSSSPARPHRGDDRPSRPRGRRDSEPLRAASEGPEGAATAAPTDDGRSAGAGSSGSPDDRSSTGSTASRHTQITAAARVWQRRLADLGGRNTLLWYQDLPSGILDLTNAHPGGVSMLMAGRGTRLSDLVREPSAFAEARRRAHVVRDKIRELDAERGLVAGFMAIGMATWNVPGARRAPQAPVLLRSCQLRPTDPAHRDYDLDLDDRLELNPALVHYLASEQGIGIDPDAITEIAYMAKRFDPMPAFRELTRQCRSVPGFRIADRRIVGTFSYAKLPMVADLAALGDDLYSHDVIAALADPGRPAPATPAARPIGTDPGDGLATLDLDADQQAVVDAVRSGSHAAVVGAPGTGRTQTVAGLAAALAADGKRVLVLAEKRAALVDLEQRLAGAGLGELVLDLHDGPIDRGRVARLVRASVDTPRRFDEPDVHDVEASLRAYRDRLVAHVDAMHEPRAPWGVSVAAAHDALSRLSRGHRAPTSRVRLSGDVLARLDESERGRVGALLSEAAGHGAWTEERGNDPWARARVSSDPERTRAARLVADLAGGRFARDRATLDGFGESVGMPPARTPARWAEMLDLVDGVRGTLELFDPEIYGDRLTDYVGATASRAVRAERGVRMWWWTRWSLRREAKTHLLEGVHVRDLHAALAAASEQRSAWGRLASGTSSPRVPEATPRAREVRDDLAADLAWLGERLSTTTGGGDLANTDVDTLADRIAALARRTDRLDVLPAVTPILDELDRLGLTPLVDDLTNRRLPVEAVRSETDFVWWSSVLDAVAADDPRVGGHDGAELRTVLEEYVRLDREFVRAGAERVLTRVGAGIDDIVDRRSDAVALVRSEAARTGRHLPMRDLVARGSEVLTAARPVWLMSPLVVASVVPPGRHFDVVILDEASQVEPAQFVSAVARAKQVVVVGDEAGLPPTSFLTAAADAERAELDDLVPTSTTTSVLDALAPRLPRFALRTQYRDRDERICGFVDAHLHGGTVATFPAAGAGSAVRLETIRPAESGESADLEAAEVARVVDLVLTHARTRPHESLGVVTLGAGQAARIVAALRVALDAERSPAAFEFFDDAAPEPFFVKPADRVQGDSRDAVVLSVGVAKDAGGRVVNRLGALQVDGGERRLGVAVSVARTRLTVVSSLTPSDLPDRHLTAAGVGLLHDLLEYAAHGGDSAVVRRQTSTARTSAEAGGSATGRGDSTDAGAAPAEERHELVTELAVRLRQEGLVVHEGYGGSGRRIDLAVEDPYRPGRVVVAVETDGRRYAAVPRPRDRDRLAVEHLRRLGWRHVRVWGLDAFADPARDVARIVDAVRSAESGSR